MRQIGYITFNGNQEINTGLYTSGVTETEVTFGDFSKSGQYGFVYGGYYDSGRAGGLFCIGSNYEAHVSLGSGEPAQINEDIRADLVTFHLKVDTSNYTGRYQWGDHTPVDFSWTGYYNKQPILIGGMWLSSKEQMGQFKLYSFKAWQNDVLVRDMRPYQMDDMTLCLYDVANDVAYYDVFGNAFAGDVGQWRIDSSGNIYNDNSLEPLSAPFSSPYPSALWVDTPTLNTGLSKIPPDFGAFANANNLSSISIPNSVKRIGEESFINTRLTEVTIARDCTFASTSFPENCAIHYYT